MFSLPEKYKKDKHISIKPFLNETLSASEKKRFKESIAEMSILYQIEGFDIPNLVNDDYHCEAIAFLDIKLTSMKAAAFVGNIVQKQVKMLCVIRFRDGTDECYCFAHKRLNKQNTTQIVVENTYSTGCMPCAFDNQKKTLFSLYIDYGTILNRNNKVCYYLEMMTKAFLIFNIELYSGTQQLLDSKIWFDFDKTLSCYDLLVELKELKLSQTKTTTIAERSKINSQIKAVIKKLEDLQ